MKEIFFAALDLPESERECFLDGVCGRDDALREEVASLLASDGAAADFCEAPAAALLALPGLPPGDPGERLLPGTRLGAYEIVGFISAGGMGEVYRARHTVLDREVAIKTVRAGAADPRARRRLLREARHAATLQHPNICAVHEVGDVGGVPFVVMALVDGRSLGEIVDGVGLQTALVLDYGTQVAMALEHAHAHGIIHRDLKSANVVIDRDGRAVVLDFGLARRLPEGSEGRTAESSATIEGAVAGTLSHMAPEILLGRSADSRSDVWSLGVLLYELATGRLPFDGRTPFETTAAILSEPPHPMGGAVPLPLRLVIERCLAKDPDLRYASATSVRAALEAMRRRRPWALTGKLLIRTRRRGVAMGAALVAVLIGSATAAPHLTSLFGDATGREGVAALAVLPFANATGEEGLAYYADALVPALIDRLGMATDTRLIMSRSSAADPDSAAGQARQVGADAAVTGRLRRAGDRIAVDVQLIAARDGRVLWSDTFERAPQHALALQADVVRAIAAELRLALRERSTERLATTRAVNPEAYEAYLKGRFEWNQRTQASLDRAVDHFNRAIELDPTYAPAHAALADCYNQFATVMVGRGSPTEYRPRAAAAATHALQIDPASAQAHAALAYARHYDWQWAEAEQGFRRAIELNPSFAMARTWYANFLMSRNRHDEALEQIHAARDLDPFSLVINTTIGWILLDAGRPREALVQLERTLELDPLYQQARMRHIDALIALSRFDEAVARAAALVEDTNGWTPAVFSLANARAAAGDAEAARTLLESVLERERGRYIAPWSVAAVYLQLGDIAEALVWFERALEERSNAIAYLNVDPAAGPLQRHPRFRQLVARAGLI